MAASAPLDGLARLTSAITATSSPLSAASASRGEAARPADFLQPLQRDAPLPCRKVGTHSLEDVVEHAHAVLLPPRVGCIALPIVSSALQTARGTPVRAVVRGLGLAGLAQHGLGVTGVGVAGPGAPRRCREGAGDRGMQQHAERDAPSSVPPR